MDIYAVFDSVLITRILCTADPEYCEKRRHLQAGNPLELEKGPQSWTRSNERHSNLICQEINQWLGLTHVPPGHTEIIYHIRCLKWKYAEAHFHFQRFFELVDKCNGFPFLLVYDDILCNDRDQHFPLYFPMSSFGLFLKSNYWLFITSSTV